MFAQKIAVAALTLALGATAAGAKVYTFGAFLLPEGVVTTGIGYTTVAIDDVAKTMSVNSSFSRLTGNTTVAHIHCCTAAPFTGNAGVATTVPTFVGFPVGVRAGVFSNSYDMTQLNSWNPAFIASSGGTTDAALARLLLNMQDGRTYFNIHSEAFPGGEIRSKLAAVPEPASWALMIGGFALAGGTLRMRSGRSLRTTA